MTPRNSAATALSFLLFLSWPSANDAFVMPTVSPAKSVSSVGSTCLDMALNNDNDGNAASSRRDLLRSTWTAAVSAALLSTQPEVAQATYSAYAAREKDWQQRQKNGEVHYSSARSLRAQLQEIAPPQNTEAGTIYCPNGPSANVSPLMENKCGDRMALFPSVYGRQEDAVGNSIPGFSQGKYNVQDTLLGGTTSSISAGTAAFPKYR